MMHNNRKFTAVIALLLATILSLTLTTTPVTASDTLEPISRTAFSLYEFAGGLWQAHFLDKISRSENLPKKSSSKGSGKNGDKNKKSTESDDDNEKEQKSNGWSWKSIVPTVNAGFATNLANAFSPDLMVSCHSDGKPAFLSLAVASKKLHGLPADIALEIGTGRSNVLSCEFKPNSGAREFFLFNSDHAEDAAKSLALAGRILIAPMTSNRALLFKIAIGSSLPPAALELLRGKDAAATTGDEYVVTHRAEIDIKHQSPDPLNRRSSEQLKRHYPVAHASAVFRPVVDGLDAALDAHTAATSATCRISLTRVTAMLTTKADALITIGVRFSGAASCTRARAQTNEEEEGRNNGTESSNNNSPTPLAGEHFVLMNFKRIADLGDDEAESEAETPWYARRKMLPTYGAIVLLVIIVGGRRAVKWFLKKKGVDMDKFIRSTNRSKEEIAKLRKERMAMKGGPMTDEEVSRLQEEEDRKFVEEMASQDK